MANEITVTLRRALTKLSSQKQRLDGQISAIETALGALGRAPQAGAPRGRKRMSPAARRAIGKRMKLYWAKRKADAARGKAKASKK